MRIKALVLLAVMASTAGPLQAQQVSVAAGDWSNIPLVKAEGKLLIADRVIDDIAAAAQKQNCTAVRRGARNIELSVPFLVEFDKAGGVSQVVVQRIGCPQVESLIGGSLLQMAKDGEYRPTLENDAGWYRGSFDISSREAAGQKNGNSVICKLVTPSGSRFPKRICGTQAQWDDMRKRGRTSAGLLMDTGGDNVE